MLRRLSVLLILCCQPLLAANVGTGDGLTLSLGSDGQVTGLATASRKLPVTPGGGFYVIDVAAVPTPARAGLAPANAPQPATAPSPRVYLHAPLKNAKGVLTQQGKLPELSVSLDTACAAAAGYISFSGRLSDLTGRDRAVEVGYEIPLQAMGWNWGDGLLDSRRISAGGDFRTTCDSPAGPGYNAIYPFSSLADRATGLSLGLPLAQGPRVYSLEYDATRQCLSIRFHFGLSRQVKKLPGQAWFSFALYQHDGRWGLRSAADRYYRLFPADFEKRVPSEGYLGYDHQETTDGTRGPAGFYGLPASGDFGRGFPWLWHQPAGSQTTEALEARLQQWQRDQPRAEPYTWCLSTDRIGTQGPSTSERVAASTMPLTYDAQTKQPAVADAAWDSDAEFVALARRHKLLMLRKLPSGTRDLGANLPFFDIGLIDYDGARNEDSYARTSGYRRPLRYWAELPQGEKRPQAVHEMFHRGLLYAIYPHLLADAAQFRRLYVQFVPVIERLSAAGWEPVTLATVTDPQVRVERYGRVADATLAFTVRNTADNPKRARLLLDGDLGLPSEGAMLEVRDLLTGNPVTPMVVKGSIILPLILGPGESAAFSVLPRHRQLQADLLQAADCLRQAAVLNTTDEMSYQASRPGQLLVGDTPATVRADTVLSDGWSSEQGLIWQAAPEPLSIRIDLNSPHRLQWLRLHYGSTAADLVGGASQLGGPPQTVGGASSPDGYETPEATVEGQDREGNWIPLGKTAATTAPLLDVTADGEYQLLRLTWPPLTKMLWLKEIEIHGEDAALLRAADRFTTLAQEPSRADLGIIGQLTIALRVRRMLGHDKTLQERALTHLADFTSTSTGLFVTVELAPDAPASGPAAAQVVVTNRGDQPLREGSIKLKLPPGWSAAPTKLDVDLPPGQSIRLPVTLVRPDDDGHLTLLITGSVGPNAIFMSRWL